MLENSPKYSYDHTHNSPANNYSSLYYASQTQPNSSCQSSMRSSQTFRSKYTSSSKLTQSQLYRTISKSNLHEKNDELLKERETEI